MEDLGHRCSKHWSCVNPDLERFHLRHEPMFLPSLQDTQRAPEAYHTRFLPPSWKLPSFIPFRKSLPRRRMLHRSGISFRLRLHHSGLYTLHTTFRLGLSYGGENSKAARGQENEGV